MQAFELFYFGILCWDSWYSRFSETKESHESEGIRISSATGQNAEPNPGFPAGIPGFQRRKNPRNPRGTRFASVTA